MTQYHISTEPAGSTSVRRLPDGDGVTDMGPTIRAAIAALPAEGGEILFGKGTYLIGHDPNPAYNYALTIVSATNLVLRGTGKGSTTLKVKDASECGGVGFYQCTGCTIVDLTVDANRAGQVATSGYHGIRGEDVDLFTISGVRIINCIAYGIGIEDGYVKRVRILNVDIFTTGSDGMDVKNKDDGTNSNEDCFIDNVTVRSWGSRADLTVQAAIDMRGPWRVSNVCIREPARNDNVGVRFRFGEAGEAANGLGGHHSSLTGFDIRMGAATAGVGIAVDARDVAISNGYINGGQDGISAGYRRVKLSNVTVEDNSDDGFIFGTGSADESHYSSLVNCHVVNSGDDGFHINTDYVRMFGCTAIGCVTGIRVAATATNFEAHACTLVDNSTVAATILSGAVNTKFIGGSLVNNGGGNTISDAGTSTILTSVT
jgi:hypothetical protein